MKALTNKQILKELAIVISSLDAWIENGNAEPLSDSDNNPKSYFICNAVSELLDITYREQEPILVELLGNYGDEFLEGYFLYDMAFGYSEDGNMYPYQYNRAKLNHLQQFEQYILCNPEKDIFTLFSTIQ